MTDTGRRLADYLGDPSDRSTAAWAATGGDGVRLIRDELEGRVRIAAPSNVHPRDAVDNYTSAVSVIAAAAPEAFLAVFVEPRWSRTATTLYGFGEIDDPRATEHLVVGARDPDWMIRVPAAMGLGRRADPAATAALIRLLDDPEYLVRYHALRSLAKVGDASALPALARAWTGLVEPGLAAAARDAIERRAAAR